MNCISATTMLDFSHTEYLLCEKSAKSGVEWLHDTENGKAMCEYNNKLGQVTFIADKGAKTHGCAQIQIIGVISDQSENLLYHFFQVMIGRLRTRTGGIAIQDRVIFPIKAALERFSDKFCVLYVHAKYFLFPLARLYKRNMIFHIENNQDRPLVTLPTRVIMQSGKAYLDTECQMSIWETAEFFALSFKRIDNGQRMLPLAVAAQTHMTLEARVGKEIIKMPYDGIMMRYWPKQFTSAIECEELIAIYAIHVIKDVSRINNLYIMLYQVHLWVFVQHVLAAVGAKADIIKSRIKSAISNPYTKLGRNRLLHEFNEMTSIESNHIQDI